MSTTNLYVFAFATFGHPNDFRQSAIVWSNPDVARKIKVFDLSNAIKVFPGSTIYSIRKEKIGNSNFIAYSIYTYAQEQASKRDGTFIGSSVILENKISDELEIIAALNSFHKNLTEDYLDNGVLKVNHSNNFNISLNENHWDKVDNPKIELPDLDSGPNNNSLVIYCDTAPKELGIYFNNSIDLLNEYDTIYFTTSQEVLQYVNQRGLFKWISDHKAAKEFENLINNVASEKKNKRAQFIKDFENRIQNIKDERSQEKENFKELSDQNDKVFSENQRKIKENKDNFQKIDNQFENILNQSNQLLNSLKQNKISVEAAIQKLNAIKAQYKGEINNIKQSSNNPYLSKAKGDERSETQNDIISQPISNIHFKNTKDKDSIKETNPYIAISIILGTLLILTLGYLFFLNNNEKVDSVDEEQSEYYNSPTENDLDVHESFSKESNSDSPSEHFLNPAPNKELNSNDVKLIAKKLKINSSIDVVVDIIFENNKRDINQHYARQKNLYKKELIELNKNCFEESNGIKLFTKDTIKHIPYFKKSE
jgi:hypothetical protein